MSDFFLIFMGLLLPVLLVASGFFSGCETALFSLTEHQCLSVSQSKNHSLVNRALTSLLAEDRSLLITLLLGNMLVNVLFFVISEVLLMRLAREQTHSTLAGVLHVLPLLTLVLLGEVVPKLTAARYSMSWSRWFAIPLLSLHRLFWPVRLLLDVLVITPLSRLFAPGRRPRALSADELEALVEISQAGGVIDTQEESLLEDVLELGWLKVRDIMIPRVDMPMFDLEEDPRILVDRMRSEKLQEVVVFEKDVDHVRGMVYARQMLLSPPQATEQLRAMVRQVMFVPEIQKLDQLLVQFRKNKSTVAVVVDEFGGTSGLVHLENVVEQMVGPLDGQDDQPRLPKVQMLEPGRFCVSARLGMHELADFFEEASGVTSLGVSTVGGWVMAKLARLPKPGDRLKLGNLWIVVRSMVGRRIDSVEILIQTNASASSPEADLPEADT